MTVRHRMTLQRITRRERDFGHLSKSLEVGLIYSGRMQLDEYDGSQKTLVG